MPTTVRQQINHFPAQANKDGCLVPGVHNDDLKVVLLEPLHPLLCDHHRVHLGVAAERGSEGRQKIATVFKSTCTHAHHVHIHACGCI